MNEEKFFNIFMSVCLALLGVIVAGLVLAVLWAFATAGVFVWAWTLGILGVIGFVAAKIHPYVKRWSK